MQIQINNHQYPDLTVLKLSGVLTAVYSEHLEDCFRAVLRNTRHIVLDFQKLEQLDSTGLGALIRCLRAALSAHSQMSLVHVQGAPKMALEVTRTHQLFDIYESIEVILHQSLSEVLAA